MDKAVAREMVRTPEDTEEQVFCGNLMAVSQNLDLSGHFEDRDRLT